MSKNVLNPSMDKKAIFNAMSSSAHVMKAVGETILLKGISFNVEADGAPIAYLFTDEEAYYTDAMSMVNEAHKLADLFADEILGEGLMIEISQIKTNKDKTVYKITLI